MIELGVNSRDMKIMIFGVKIEYIGEGTHGELDGRRHGELRHLGKKANTIINMRYIFDLGGELSFDITSY